MMSTVLSVYTRPVKTDSKTRASVHNDVSSPSVAQQSDRPGRWKESEVQRQPPNGRKSGQRNAKQKYLQIGKTNARTISHIPTTHKVAQKERSTHWKRSPISRLKDLGERPVKLKQGRRRNTTNATGSRQKPSTKKRRIKDDSCKKNDRVFFDNVCVGQIEDMKSS